MMRKLMVYQITNQRDLRKAFWQVAGDDTFQVRRKRLASGDYSTDARVAWCDYVDACVRSGIISEALAQRATL